MKTVDSAPLQQLIFNRTGISFTVCNILDIELIKLELTKLATTLEVFTIDFSLIDHCPRVTDALLTLTHIEAFTTKHQHKALGSIEKLRKVDALRDR